MGDALPGFPFVLRSDVKSYYASLDQELLLAQLHDAIADPRLVTILERYVRRTVYQDGLYRDVTQGISLGCPLSPLIAALYLKPLDERLEATGLFYARFMDDWVVLAPTRWKLRWAARLMQQTLAELKVQTHPGKTFLGRTARGRRRRCVTAARISAGSEEILASLLGAMHCAAEADRNALVAKATVELLDHGEALEVSTRRLQELWDLLEALL